MRLRPFLVLLTGGLLCSSTQAAVDLTNSTGFPLVTADHVAPLIVPADAAEVVHLAAADFAADVERVTGQRPSISDTPPTDPAAPRIVITLAPDLADRWEAFQLSASATELTVAGADRRALAFGLYELSRRIGVSPWAWWADVPVTPRDSLHLSLGTEPVDQPAVKYRGVFLNDEGWGLRPWAAQTFEPEAGNIGPKTYARIFELLLRLRGNSIWPAMHPGTTPFHLMPGNAATADRYAIVVGSSHAEPMLRNNVGEWTQDHHLYNYVTNREGVLAYWEERVAARTSGESIFTLGMRGIHDSGMMGADTQEERLAVWERIFADQRDLLARHLGDGDPTRIAQIFVPYKEVLPDYNAGLRVPDDVTIVWPDDNFGYVRRYATPAERARAGGLGVYYHLSYLGAPFSWLWVDTIPTALIWSEMTRAYEQGARTLWIGNVGDFKGQELSAEYFLDLAWHADRTTPDHAATYLQRVAARDFGAEHAAAIADLWTRHQVLAAARKPEHLQWQFPTRSYQPTTYTAAEMHERLDAYAALVADTEAVAATLPAAAQDAFFQRVTYQVGIAAAMNERYFRAELARLAKASGIDDAADELWAESEAGDQRWRELTRHYNEEVADGKWRHIVQFNGMDMEEWRPRFQPDPDIPPLDSVAQEQVHLPPPAPHRTPPVIPADARPGDFFEQDGVISIHAGHFTSQRDLSAGAGWRVVPGLGRTGNAVTILPSTATIEPAHAPLLSYRFHVTTGGPATVHVRLLPTFPIEADAEALRFALAVNDGPAQPGAVTDGFNTRAQAWRERVVTNATETTVKLAEPLSPGWHTLHLIGVEPGVVVDKLVIDLGGLRPSYNGPAETSVAPSS
ncbi:glycosyl hydrolase 115 family protein [Actomonas aquatica]|uniref:Glycosyl hydrolase 115 family protein n=1 Tax=Actomonas aquatica TaxID=2866162 RepID=A0ABZ1C4S6_9BACT|nr:glycosyl hydrolase 115 family protein [Opitutus sp. WL0086]WRQ86729.1 glycosyl hydrolase 115 family protein [Opitutus sp. WL0086]